MGLFSSKQRRYFQKIDQNPKQFQTINPKPAFFPKLVFFKSHIVTFRLPAARAASKRTKKEDACGDTRDDEEGETQAVRALSLAVFF